MTQKSFNFQTIHLEATRRCNLNCKICMVGCNDPEIVKRSIREELTTDEITEYILKSGKELGAHYIMYSGGEFLLRKDALELVERAVRLDYEPRILTNSTLINEGLIQELKTIAGAKLMLVFGINSIVNKKLNRKTRDVEIDKVFSALELCKRYKVKRHVVVNVGSYNKKHLESTFQWLTDNRITFNRSPFSARMSGARYFCKMGYSKEDIEKYIHPSLVKRVNGYNSYTPFFLSPDLYNEISNQIPCNPPIGCWIGTWLIINAEGYVAPCVLLADDVQGGNVREKPLHKIIEESRLFREILNRDNLKGKCGRCRYKWTCGGCRAMAYFHSGDYMGEDPTCFFEPQDESSICSFERETNITFLKYLRSTYHGGMYKMPKRSNPEDLAIDTSYMDGDEDRINKLFNIVFHQNRNLNEWTWKFKKHPRTFIIIARDGDKIVGHMGCIVFPLKYFDTTSQILHIVDYMVHPIYSKGYGSASLRMFQKVYDICRARGIQCSYAFPNRTGYILAKRLAGYKDHLCTKTYFKRLSWRLAVRKRLPLGTVADVADKISRLFIQLSSKVKYSRRPKGVEYRWVDFLDEKKINQFWETVKDKYDIMLKRDYAYLNWRYIEKPGNHYHVLQAERDGNIIGIAVVRSEQIDHEHVGFISECLSLERRISAGLLNRSLVLLSQFKTDYVLCRISSYDPLADILQRLGFIYKQGMTDEYSICRVFTEDIDEKVFQNNAGWHITFGDTEI
jgi:radical SAM protein with 4Fe4S-binding SPASM domain